jgi:hypothetical protein
MPLQSKRQSLAGRLLRNSRQGIHGKEGKPYNIA